MNKRTQQLCLTEKSLVAQGEILVFTLRGTKLIKLPNNNPPAITLSL